MSASFSSVTTWDVQTYLLEVTVNGFDSIESAKTFGRNSAKKLIWEGTNLVLITDTSKIQLQENNIKVLELTPEAQKKTMIGDEDDFIERNIPIETLAQMNEFKNGFSSLSYGVKDENQMTVKLCN